MTQEALTLALEAFYQIFESTPPYRDDGTCVINDKSVELSNKAIAAIKEALAQEQEPVKMIAYNCFCGRTMKFESVHGVVAPQRTWVGLIDKDMNEPKTHIFDFIAGARWAESILKERNT